MIQLFDSEQQLLKILGGSTILQVRVHDQSYCLVNDRGSYFLIEPTCPHSNYPMSDSKLSRQGEVICMWHAYRFDLKSGKERLNRCTALKTYPLSADDKGALWVSV